MKFRVRRYVLLLIVLFSVVNMLTLIQVWSAEEGYKTFPVWHRVDVYKTRALDVTLFNKKVVPTASHFVNLTVTSSQCPNVKYPTSLRRHEHWAAVNAPATMYVYSGYVNIRAAGTVSVVGVMTSLLNGYRCQVWYVNATRGTVDMIVVNATVRRYHSSPHKYVAGELTCILKDKRVPDSVSVVTSTCMTPLNLIALKGPPATPYRHNFTMCLMPLNIRYGRAYELVEWIELNRILGADKFVFYNYSIRPNVDRVLREYSERGIAEVLPWDIPVRVHTWPPSKMVDEVAYFGQTAQLNDCLLRCKLNSRYLVNTDLDEFPIPHRENTTTWAELIRKLPSSSVYMFRNTFFRKEWKTNETFPRLEEALKYRMTTLLQTLRETKIFIRGQRSKYIARTDRVGMLQVHDASASSGGRHVLEPADGLLHHYRNWLIYNDKTSRLADRTVAEKYMDVLINRVVDSWSHLEGVELDIPI